jgi:DNA-binding transcriptional LysR family regulator
MGAYAMCMPLPDLSPHALASLLAVAEHGSVSAAARARNLTQPSISRQIQELERQLGVHLIERTSQGARLTPAGERLCEGARDILAALSSLPERVRILQGEVAGRVRVGTIDSIGIHVLPPLLAEFVSENPRVEVQVVCQSSPQLMAMLLDDEIDVAIGTTEHPKLVCERLYQNPLVVAYPTERSAEDVPDTLAALVKERIVTFSSGLTIRSVLDQAFAKQGLSFQPVMGLANVEVIKSMVRAGLGLGIIPDGCLIDHEVGIKPIRDLAVSRTIRLIHRSNQPSMATQRMIETLRTLRHL